MYECLIIYLRKNTSETELELLIFFTFINFFMKTFINQEPNLLQGCAFGPFTYVRCENCMLGSLPLFLT